MYDVFARRLMSLRLRLSQLLGSAYLLGGNADHLTDIYEDDSKSLEQWKDSPGEISTYDWRDFLGNREYQRAFVDFFEDQLVTHGYDWKAVIEEYTFKGKNPLVNCLVSGLGHPLIHLGYAYEISSREVAMEALGLAATCYSDLHKYLDDPGYAETETPYRTSSPLEILSRLQNDQYFDDIFDAPGGDNMTVIFRDHEAQLLSHWNAWDISDPTKQFQDTQEAAAALLLASGRNGYDFFIVHLLTTSHAVRILLPLIPSEHHIALLRQWWLVTLAIYIAQLRPQIDIDSIKNYDLKGKSWTWIDDEAVGGKWSLDAHFVKAVRALKESARTWGDKDELYLKAAAKFTEEFRGWEGFGASEERLEVRR
ncbi:MAG: hypothetical protein Q9160_002517 [Pyrenula sp. 1 TL-2023]